MIKPKRLKLGDTFAAVSLSSGTAGDPEILWRYEQGKAQLIQMGFKVVELDLTLAGSEVVYTNPQKRAEDLHTALLDPNIDGIISNIGGFDSIRLLEYIDWDILRNNPKPFIGYSVSTSIHQMFQVAGVVSFYGPCLLVDFAENGGVMEFTKEIFEDILMKDTSNYTYPWRKQWTAQYLPWLIENKHTARTLTDDEGPIVLQGQGIAEGKLLGGCLEVLSNLKGTKLYPSEQIFKDGLLLLETSERCSPPTRVEDELRTMGVTGRLQLLNGILVAKPHNNTYFQEYQEAIRKTLKEFGLEDLPVLYNCNFGHTEPKWTLPLGIKARLDLEKKTLTLLESATQ